MGKHLQETKAARRHVIIGLWMLRSGVFDEIRKIWNRKWKSY